MTIRPRFHLVGLLVLALVLAACAGAPAPTATLADVFPGDKPINFCSAGAGGGGDTLARQLIAASERLGMGVKFIVQNNAPAGEQYACVWNAPHDGYHIWTFPRSYVLSPITAGAAHNPEDFAGIQIQFDLQLFSVKADSPLQTMEDVIAASKSKKLKIGGTSIGTLDSITFFAWQKASGLNADYVPFSKTPEVNTALLGGHVDAIMGQGSDSWTLYESKQIRHLGLASEKRADIFPGVPTFAEKGWPQVNIYQWRALLVPKDVPDGRKKKLDELFQKMASEPGFLKWTADAKMVPAFKVFDQFTPDLYAQWQDAKKVLADLGITAKK